MPDNRPRQQPRRRRKKRSPVYGLVSFVVICAAMVFGMSVFFRVSTIEVVGMSRYTQEEIIEASGIQEGDNLFFISRFSAGSKIIAKLPYVKEASITRKLPSRILIEVSESTAMAYLSDGVGGVWVVDSSCKLLSEASTTDISGMIRVDGLVPFEPEVGEVLKTEDGSTGKVTFLSTILSEILFRDMIKDVSRIDMSNAGSPSFEYLDRFTVKLGSNESVDYKFELMLGAVDQLGATATGTIDLSVDKRANFTPD